MLNHHLPLQLSLGCCWVQGVQPAKTPAVAPPSTASPFLFPQGSWCQDCSTFWRRPPRITNAQMRIGGESDPDSDVLQLVAGVKKKTLCQPLACIHCIYACMHTSVPLHVFPERASLCASCICILACALADIWCVCAHVHDASKPLHVTCYGGTRTNNPFNTPSISSSTSSMPPITDWLAQKGSASDSHTASVC